MITAAKATMTIYIYLYDTMMTTAPFDKPKLALPLLIRLNPPLHVSPSFLSCLFQDQPNLHMVSTWSA